MQFTPNAPYAAPTPTRSSQISVASRLEIALVAVCVTLALSFLVFGDSSPARQDDGVAAAPVCPAPIAL